VDDEKDQDGWDDLEAEASSSTPDMPEGAMIEGCSEDDEEWQRLLLDASSSAPEVSGAMSESSTPAEWEDLARSLDSSAPSLDEESADAEEPAWLSGDATPKAGKTGGCGSTIAITMLVGALLLLSPALAHLLSR